MTGPFNKIGAIAAVSGAQIRTGLGFRNVFAPDGTRLSHSQIGDFRGARRRAPGVYDVNGPDAVFPQGRLQAQSFNITNLGLQFEPGRPKALLILFDDAQSNGAGATAGGRSSDAGATATLYNTRNPLPNMLCFNGGIRPLAASPGGSTALATVLSPASIASVVPAADAINPLLQRDTPIYSAMLAVADALRGTDHAVFGLSDAIGSTSLSERLIGFTGSRAAGTVSISGTTATITVASGSLSADNLILIGAGLAANTTITTTPAPTGTGTFSVQVTPSQSVSSVAFTTQDQKPQQYKNMIAALDAAATWARANGYTPMLPFVTFIGGEAEGDAQLVANGINSLKTLRTVANEFAARLYAGTVNAGQIPWIINAVVASPRYLINQDPPANTGNNSPSLENMGLVSNMALAAVAMVQGVDATGAAYDTKSIAIPAYHLPADPDGRVHFGNDSIGHVLRGQDIGAAMVALGAGQNPIWPQILRAKRTKGSLSVAVTFSEPCEFDGGQLVSNPGQYGFSYGGGGSFVAITGFDWAGNVLTLTLASEPTGAEALHYACDNAELFTEATSRNSPFGLASLGPASGGWPFDVPVYGLGNQRGQRGNVRAAQVYAWSVQTGRPLHRYAVQQKVAVDVDAGAGNVLAMHSVAGVTPAFLMDLGDPACLPPSSQTLTDLSAGAAAYWLGVDGTTANDPTYVPAAAGIPAWARFDGTPGVKSGKVILPQGTPAFLADLHKAGGAAVITVAFFVPSYTTFPTIQYLLANCSNEVGGGAGVAVRVGTTGQPGINIRGAGGSSVLSVNLPGTAKVVPGWNVISIGWQAGASGWAWDSNASKFVGTLNTFAATYTSPSSGAAEAAPVIGANFKAAVANMDTLVSGAGIGGLWVAPYSSATDALPIFRSACARFGLPIGALDIPTGRIA